MLIFSGMTFSGDARAFIAYLDEITENIDL
jgi:hypothetical protein